MKIKRIKQLAWLEFQENRRRILASIPVLILFSIIGFILPLIRTKESDLELILRLFEIYQISYPDLSSLALRHIILSDLSLPLILLTAALVSPFLGILDSITSEREKRTIENLLVLPVSEAEIITGKMITCVTAGIFLSWLLWIGHYIFLIIYSSAAVANHLVGFKWLVLGFLVVPVCALLMNLIGIILAVQVKKAQTGYNLGFIILFPLALMISMIGLGSVEWSVKNLFTGFVVLVISDVILFKIAYKTFNREKILLKYR